jgi:hypothetical protein
MFNYIFLHIICPVFQWGACYIFKMINHAYNVSVEMSLYKMCTHEIKTV